MARDDLLAIVRTTRTRADIRGSLTVLDYLRQHAGPVEHQAHPVIPISHVLTPWEIRDDDTVACELIRHYAERLN
jgi:hypothetical protein